MAYLPWHPPYMAQKKAMNFGKDGLINQPLLKGRKKKSQSHVITFNFKSHITKATRFWISIVVSFKFRIAFSPPITVRIIFQLRHSQGILGAQKMTLHIEMEHVVENIVLTVLAQL